MGNDQIVRLRATVTGIEHFLNTKADVTCDQCHALYHTDRWGFMDADERARLAVDLRADGWIVDGDHERHVCPDCVTRTEYANPVG